MPVGIVAEERVLIHNTSATWRRLVHQSKRRRSLELLSILRRDTRTTSKPRYRYVTFIFRHESAVVLNVTILEATDGQFA